MRLQNSISRKHRVKTILTLSLLGITFNTYAMKDGKESHYLIKKINSVAKHDHIVGVPDFNAVNNANNNQKINIINKNFFNDLREDVRDKKQSEMQVFIEVLNNEFSEEEVLENNREIFRQKKETIINLKDKQLDNFYNRINFIEIEKEIIEGLEELKIIMQLRE